MKTMSPVRLAVLAGILGLGGLLAACGSSTATSAAPAARSISGGLAPGGSPGDYASADKSAIGSSGPANQPATNAVLTAQGDQKIIQDASLGIRIKSGSFWDSYNQAVTIAARFNRYLVSSQVGDATARTTDAGRA